MSFVYRVLWILKAFSCELFCLKPSMFWEIRKKKKLGCLWEFYHMFMYIAPSSGRSLLSLNVPFNPYPTGGGGVNLTPPPPVRNLWLPCDRRRSRHAFSWLFPFKSYASFDTKFAVKIGPSVARSRDVLYFARRHKIYPKSAFCICLCYKHTWKLLIFLKCTKTMLILSLGPFA